jgi:hypothetical protein
VAERVVSPKNSAQVFQRRQTFGGAQTRLHGQGLLCASGQGTIEYLVILAIVIVISLVVVGLVMQQMSSSSNVSSTASEIKLKTGVDGISIVESVAGLDQNGLLVLKNMGSETITINKISVGGVDHNFSDSVVMGSQLGFKLSDIVVCDGTKKVYSVKIYFTSSSGLGKSADFENITIDCTNIVIPSGNFVEETNSGGGVVVPPVGHSCGEIETPVGYTEISSCPVSLNSGENYILTTNLICSLTIAANDVNLNGNYCRITGNISASGSGDGANAYTDLNLNNIIVVGNVFALGQNANYDAGDGGNIYFIDSNVTGTVNTYGGNGDLANEYNGSGGNGGLVFLQNSIVGNVNTYGGNYELSWGPGVGGDVIASFSTLGSIDTHGGTAVTYSGGGDGGNGGRVILTDSNSGSIYSNGGDGFSLSGTHSGNGGRVSLLRSNVGSISSSGGGQGDVWDYAGAGAQVDLNDSTADAITSNGGTGFYSNGTGGTITLRNSSATTISSNGYNSTAHTYATSGNGGIISLTDSTANNITADGSPFDPGLGVNWMRPVSSLGVGGTVNIVNSIVENISAKGGYDLAYTDYYLSAGNGGNISLTGALTETGDCNVPGGSAYSGIGGNGGNILLVSQCPNISNIGAFDCSLGTGSEGNGVDGTCPHSCS